MSLFGKDTYNYINNEIDYDKLTKAIVKAAEEKEKRNILDQNEKYGFWKAVIQIIFNKQKTNGTMVSGLLSCVLSFFFNAIAVLGVLLLFCIIAADINIISEMDWGKPQLINNIAFTVLMVICIIIVTLLILFFRASANEISVEKDRNYIVSVFSGIVSFAAFIVALVALLKGVLV